MIDSELLKIIACPETKQELVLADTAVVEKLNTLIENGELECRSGQKVDTRIDGGLIQKEDRKYLYPVRNGIPILLIDHSIDLEQVVNP